MKSLFAFGLLVALLGLSVNAQEIEVGKPVLIGKVPKKVKQFQKEAGGWVEVDGYGYAFMVYLKNISDKRLTVATDGFSSENTPNESKQNFVLEILEMRLTEGGALVIPSRESLKLVDLRPGEAAPMKIEFKAAVPLEELTVTYKPQDFYDGRFGYWIGKVSSLPLKVEN